MPPNPAPITEGEASAKLCRAGENLFDALHWGRTGHKIGELQVTPFGLDVVCDSCAFRVELEVAQ